LNGPRLALVALFAAVTPACASFDDPSTVIDLRVLAIQTDPSEIILDRDDRSTNVPVRMTPLIIDPAGGGRPITYTVLACPNDPFAAAPPGPGGGGGAFPSGGARTTVGSAPCDETSDNTWSLTPEPITFDPAAPTPFTIALTDNQLIAAFMADVFPDQYGNLHGGFDLGEPVRIQLNIQAGDESLIAIKRILYWGERLDDAQSPNELPVVDAVEIFPARDPDTAEPVGEIEPLVEGIPKVIAATDAPWIRPTPARAESYETTVLDADTHKAVPLTVERETIRYAYYATAGTFEPARRSSELPSGFVGIPTIESQYKPPADLATIPLSPDGRRLVTIWIVMRDDRGGESWQTRTLEIAP
jgi:hypothetical protein